jgi:hypothetical protein
MRTTTRAGTALLMTIATGATAHGQSSIPVRQLTVEATSTEAVGSLNGVRELADGRVLVNDAGKRRVLVFDRQLSTVQVVADTTPGRKIQYGSRPTGIVPYQGDSTLLIDLPGRAFLVLDASGNATRVMSAPRPNDLQTMAGGSMGAPSLDRSGRLVYRTMIMPSFRAPVVGKAYTPPVIPDSAPLLRADFDTRVADTLAWLRVPVIKVNTNFLPNGGVVLTPVFSPISTIDDWTALPDGSIAILRGSDYHIDWIGADGIRSSTPKMPFDWKRLTDEDKASIIDSTKKALERQSQVASTPGGMTPGAGAGAGGHGGAPAIPAGHSMTIMPVGSDDGAPLPQSANKGPSLPAVVQVVEASDLPDYYPPILQSGEMKADFNGNIWILPSTTLQAGRGLLYDVVNRKGELVERMRLPEGRALEGFGANGAVYLTSHGANGTRFERARLP